MRSDFLGDCALFSGLPEALNASQFLTPRLTREERYEAITSPAQVFGGRVDEELAARVLNDMGADPDSLPLMQHALSRMWAHAAHRAASGETPAGANDAAAPPPELTLRDLEAAGGVNSLFGDDGPTSLPADASARATLRLTEGQNDEPTASLTLAAHPDAPGADGAGDVRVEPALVTRMFVDLGAGPGGLARLPRALARLRDRARLAAEAALRGKGTPVVLTSADYDAVGGITDRTDQPNALSAHIDEVFGKLDERGRGIAEVLFRSLTERGREQRDTRREVTLKEVFDVASERLPGTTPDQVVAVVDVFRAPDLNVVMPPHPETLLPGTVLDITHEALIRQWARLRAWVATEADSAQIYRRLSGAGAEFPR
jgi:hypothetical protein